MKKYVAIMEAQWRINFFVSFCRALQDGRFIDAFKYWHWSNDESLGSINPVDNSYWSR